MESIVSIPKKYLFLIFSLFIVFVLYQGLQHGALVASAPQGALDTKTYVSQKGFSVAYPQAMRVDDAYTYSLGNEKEISGTAFFMPLELTTGTNLSSDSRVSVEILPKTETCEIKSFLSQPIETQKPLILNGLTYTVATITDAAAGNRYEETVSLLSNSKQCIAVRLFLHTTAIENYDPKTIQQYNADAIMQIYDTLRTSLVVA
jgi:hypothetical protein